MKSMIGKMGLVVLTATLVSPVFTASKPTPTPTPTVTPTQSHSPEHSPTTTPAVPEFEAISATAGLLVVAYLVMVRRN